MYVIIGMFANMAFLLIAVQNLNVIEEMIFGIVSRKRRKKNEV